MPDTTIIKLTAPNLTGLTVATAYTDSQLNSLTTATVAGTTSAPLTLDSALATHLTVTINDANYDALIAEAHQLPATGNADRYQFVLRPWLWWLTLSSNNRVFQNLSAQEIVEKVFKDGGFSDYKFQLKSKPAKREYCLQYNESDFNFISRLLEQEGIFWFFTHAEGKHTLVLADDNSAFPPIPGEKKVKYQAAQSGARETGMIRSAQLRLQATAQGFQGSDYNYEQPKAALFSQAGEKKGGMQYQHPGRFSVKAEGDALAAWKVNALKAQAKQLVGESDCAALMAGHWFTLTDHDDKSLNIDWLVTAVSHEYDGEHYRNRFTAIPKATPYRPLAVTPQPFMHTQTATVVGKSGEEIWTDKLGRVKVQFPWDREGKSDETSSCWLRVATAWSGNGFGVQFIPRIGQEVVVSFIDGSPDKPLITGCVYNGANALPYALPANQTQSGIKTKSEKGFNELRFDDKKDAELLAMQAQKDFQLTVLNDSKTTVSHDEIQSVKNDRIRTVEEGNETVTLKKGNRTVKIEKGSDTLEVKDKRSVTVKGDQEHAVDGNETHKVKGNYTLKVDGNLTIKVSGTLTLESSKTLNLKSGADLSASATSGLKLDATNIASEAKASLTQKAATISHEAKATLTSKASATQTVDGGGMLIIKGGLVRIN
ncbi:type VI secretion system tip protein VgrG [Salmonella bongori]|uniref:type VI secretion system Vgr family protein n=1 Tax=Salmonella bongori TaxID=54736 RepID=UPI00128A3E34|nr:type VI secretion system tip protein TssI/VgrG [Salmonella bongori]ECG8260113.1 type VI secretion system tip protein VgrG [Salmonella bongori serovar 48:i:-]ECG9251932.1 type VI secretion system tip protein VgrG [Salmonella bongori]EDP8707246.1 type VI secretion system tip protein VgrG [Salmonella bongori]EDP8725682.1 type VI secretion system tip protein VgrG [Salmonella bongori]EEO9370470.1 type VI secretion system tip protein VgrG [Salmonella bongori]